MDLHKLRHGLGLPYNETTGQFDSLFTFSEPGFLGKARNTIRRGVQAVQNLWWFYEN